MRERASMRAKRTHLKSQKHEDLTLFGGLKENDLQRA